MIVSSIIPPFSFKSTDRVDENGAREPREEGMRDIRKSWADGPVNMC
jgi:hypothetical protein